MRSIKRKWIVRGIVFGIALISVLTLLTMLLWNTLAVPLFGLPVIDFFQALGLMVLGRLLAGGFGPRGWRGGRHHFMRERWKNMTEEERMQFKRRWHHGPHKPDDEPDTKEEGMPDLPPA